MHWVGESHNELPVLVVVGNGMVGHHFCDKLAELKVTERFKVVVFGEEPRVAYDRVHLTEFFATRQPESLALAGREFYTERGIELCTGERVDAIDRDKRVLTTSSGRTIAYHTVVLATGSTPWVPAIPGVGSKGVFVYRTIEDLEAITAYASNVERCAVLGGGLLGLEAARAMKDLGLTSYVIELAPRLMPNQLDATASKLLEREVKSQGVEVILGQSVRSVKTRSRDEVGGVDGPNGALEALELSDGTLLDVQMLVVSAGIRPRDDLAKKSGITLGARGGVEVDDTLCTSDKNIFAIGEVALHRGKIYGLVAPGYAMSDVLARRLAGEERIFEGGDLSTKLKLLGVEVASFGDPFLEGEGIHTVAYQDFVTGVYKRLLVSTDGKRLHGGILVGDAKSFTELAYYAREAAELPGPPEELVFTPKEGGGKKRVAPDTMQICSCHNVTKGGIRAAVEGGKCSLDEVKKCTKAGTGCGGCVPAMTDIINAELLARGAVVKKGLCEHFEYSRQELFQLVSVNRIKTFDELIARHGQGYGCEICKPAAAAIFASTHNEMVLGKKHATLQDTNDRFLANIQRQGLYSIVPRVPGGEITPEKLIVLGQVAKKYNLYTKITGGQRIDLFGASVNQLPEIWEELVAAGFESGHAYGKALRTVKSCVGSTWCRYGVQDSVGLAIRVENRYKGLRSPHKLKSAVSGCTRECAEAQSKDFGIIATEHGYNLYVCGNGGMKPRHADLIATDLDELSLIRLIDRFLMFYIRTADRLTRTSVWLEKLEGGIDHLKAVIIDDKLGICDELERQMQHLVDTYECEWAAVVNDPDKRAQFKHFVNTNAEDPTLTLVSERGMAHPAPWPKEPKKPKRKLELVNTRWLKVANLEEMPLDGGVNFKHGEAQIAVFRFASRNELYATQNMCPHKQDMVLSRGILGDQAGEPKVACPLHKKTFALKTGECLTGDDLSIRTFPVKEVNGEVFVELPPPQQLVGELCPKHTSTYVDAAE